MDADNVITYPCGCAEPESFGDALASRIASARHSLEDTERRFAIWDSLSQDVKDKLDQLAGYKPLDTCEPES